MLIDKILASRELFRVWRASVPQMVYRTTLSLVLDPGGALRYFQNVLELSDLTETDPVLGSLTFEEFVSMNFPEATADRLDVRIVGQYQKSYLGGTGRLLEIAGVAFLVQLLKPSIVFEIGTFRGQTTRILAMNGPQGGQILTLDLDPTMTEHKVGELFLASPEREAITQLSGDSRVFDFSPWAGRCEFVWVDACHDYEFVVSDTNNAFKLAAPGGVIGWHDYRHAADWSGVTRGLREFAKMNPGVTHIQGTTICLYRKPK